MYNIKIGLFLMTYKGYFVLKELIQHFGSDIISFVCSSKDDALEKDYYNEIVSLSETSNIPLYSRHDKIEFEYAFAIGWKWIIPNKNQLIVFHDSLLPKYRGFSPVVSALINKEPKVGVTAILANDEYDKGNIIYQQSLDLVYPIKISDVILKLAPIYSDLSKKIWIDINNNSIQTTLQNEDEASYSLWRDEDDYLINWADSAENIKLKIDAVGYPYKGASTFLDDKKYRILDATVYKQLKIENVGFGKVLFIDEYKPIVVCGSGLLKIESVISDSDKEDALPLKKFRTRFK